MPADVPDSPDAAEVAGAEVSGMPMLGRGVVVAGSVEAPEPWRRCPEIRVGPGELADPAAVVSALHARWIGRDPVVVRLAVDPAEFRTPTTWTTAPWDLGSDFTPWLDRLHFLVWQNNYDARSGVPIWWWTRKAVRLGAVEGGPADVVLADGTAAWIDGGPVDDVHPTAVAPAALIRAESVEGGRLDIVPAWSEPVAALARDQLAAVAHRGGPARIIAPAGSGKTRVLTERLRHLVVDRGHHPDGLVAVAYNRKAQEEMAGRLPGLPVRIRTLNALGYELVTRHAGARPRLLDETEVRRRLEPHLPRLQRRLNTDPMAPYLEGLSLVRLGLLEPELAEETADAPGLADAVEPYRRGLRRDGVLDFDEQIVHAIELLLGDGAFRRSEQSRHRHLLVDEFQDLTPAHVLLIRLLATPGFDVFGVGDDDQVIYGHAGASPRFLVDFESLFPGASSHPLETNYRCPPAVVDAARTLLGYNRRRVDKEIVAARADRDPAALVHVAAGEDPATDLVAQVQALVARTGSTEHVAVLTRTNSLLLAPHVALHEAGVPVDSVLRRDVLDRVGTRAALAWLRAGLDPGAIAPADLAELRRRPSRGFPNWIDKWLARCTSSHEVRRAADRVDDGKVADKLRALAADVDLVAGVAATADTATILLAIRDEVGLGGAMALLDARPGAEGSSHVDDLDALVQVARLHPEASTFESWLRHAVSTRDPDPGGVTLSTVHRVKGQEWPAVVVFGVDAGIFPHRLAEDVEEERRVLHVAITRGIDHVVVVHDRRRPSPFLAEMDGSAPVSAVSKSPPARATALRPSTPSSRTRGSTTPLQGDDEAMFQKLRAWRTEVARRQGGPAFTVFVDATLEEIARARPASPAELARVKGVGPAKLENYGDEVLALVAAGT